MAELADALDSGSSEGSLHAGSSPVSRTKSRTLKAFGFSIVRHMCRTIVSDIADKCSCFWHHFHLKIRRETQRRHEGDTKFAPDRANGFHSKI